MSERMTVEQWYDRRNQEVLSDHEVQQILWDWQNDRVKLLEKITELQNYVEELETKSGELEEENTDLEATIEECRG